MKKRILAVLLCVLLIAGSVSFAYATNADTAAPTEYVEQIVSGEGEDAETFTFVEAASNDNFILAIDEATTFISLTDKRTGQVWYSNPPITIDEDPYVEGIAKTDIRSVLHLTYTNSTLKVKEANSYAGSVMQDSYEIKKVDNGLRVDYLFKEIGVTIPVQYTLTDDGMIAEILYSEIIDSTDSTEEKPIQNTVNNMDFMMYFGTAGENDEGYLVVPDGSGAIIEFNNKKNVDSLLYSKEFYGDDHSETTEADIYTSREESLTLPVFGMVKNGYGFLAEITSGAEAAKLEAATAGNRLIGGYNTIYVNANYRTHYSIPLMGQIGGETSNAMYNAQDSVSCESFAVQYHFSDNNQTTYMTMAADYRDILMERGWLAQDEGVTDKFYTEFYGAVTKKKSFIGILYNARETLTSFEDAEEILADLVEGGVTDISAQYVNFSNDFFSRDIEVGLDASGSLGGNKGMAALLDFAAEEDLVMALEANFVQLPTGGHGFSTFFDVADAINVSPIEVFPVSLHGNTFDTSKKPYYLLMAEKYGEAVDVLMESVEELGYKALYFDDNALQLYSDLAPGGYQSERTSVAMREQMARLAESGTELTFSNPNAYLFAYADYMVNIPVCSSKELIFDGDIPFLQTVIRGLKNFGGESMNITDVSDDSFLRHLEYGTDMRYALIESDSEALLNTDHTFLYSATYENFSEQIKERYKAFVELGEAVGTSNIADHSKADGVAVTTYSNGTKVYVNYNDEAVTIDGVTVDAMGYAIV